MVIREKGCPKCRNDVWLDQDDYGWYEQCLVCGYLCSLDGLKYVCDVETFLVTKQYKPKLYPFQSVIKLLNQAMKTKVDEARANILTELTQGSLEKRQLWLRIIHKGIIWRTFDTALKELKDSGMVMVVAIGKSKRKKLTLSAGGNLAGA